MKSHRKELWFETTTRRAYINITDDVARELQSSPGGGANGSGIAGLSAGGAIAKEWEFRTSRTR